MATLTEEQLDGFRRDGYLVYGPLLDLALVGAVGERIDALAAGTAPVGESAAIRLEPGAEALEDVTERDKAWQLLNVARADEVIRTVTELPALVGLIRQLLQTPEVSFLQDQVLMKPAFHGSQGVLASGQRLLEEHRAVDRPAGDRHLLGRDRQRHRGQRLCADGSRLPQARGSRAPTRRTIASCTYKASTSTPPDLSCSHAAG